MFSWTNEANHNQIVNFNKRTRVFDYRIYDQDQRLINFNGTDVIMILHIEAPFRTSFYIDKAINTLQLFNCDSVIAVRQNNSLFYKHNGHGLEPLQQNNRLRLERNFLYRHVGGMKAVKKKHFEKYKTIIGGKVAHVILDEKSGWMIDSEMNWDIAEYIYENKKTYNN